MRFEAFFETVNGFAPFPWQVRLAQAVAARQPPAALDLPTGAGKTALVDVWIWARLHGHRVPCRLFFVIDRRIVVDEVAERGRRIVEIVRAKGIGAPDQVPHVQALRGGQVADHSWMLDPARPALVSTTVDQFGSRILFRGYGVSASSAPIHAALTGIDAWIAIDEAHLSQPLCKTLRRIGECRRPGSLETQLPWWLTELTATPAHPAEALTLQEDDRAHPVLSARLAGAKPAELVTATADDRLDRVLAREALRLRKGGAGVVATVANQVDIARAVFETLRLHGEAILLTGRQRPFDRADVVDNLLPRILASHSADARAPLYVVATQTIEVGLDADFDALVTQAAPLSALRQRFGRLNRMGRLPSAPAVIVVSAGPDPVYGEATKACVQWLKGQAQDRVVDFGVDALRARCASDTPPAEPAAVAPRLSDAQLRLLSHTWPAPDIEVGIYLHGPQRDADVRIAWRADLDGVDLADWAEVVDAAPLQIGELMAVPAGAARAWLRGAKAQISDLGAQPLAFTRAPAGTGKPVLRIDTDEPAVIDSERIRPGMTIVVPASYGGCDAFGWAPDSKAAVSDFGDRDADRLRLHAALLGPAAADGLNALAQIDRPTPADAVDLLGLDPRWRPARLIRYLGGFLLEPRTRSNLDTRTQRAIGLAAHQAGVAARAAAYARAIGLDATAENTLHSAGAQHDVGKADPRFQVVLGGTPQAPLAKGSIVAIGRAAARLYAEAGLDPAWRHEVASLRNAQVSDPLLRHLIGSHHGRGRPWLPAAPDPNLYASIDGDEWPLQFARLQAQHGLWGLAFLEALVRLADWQQSAQEQGDQWSD
jgi:CRISPR-associated endonuclease/helicase Cas3